MSVRRLAHAESVRAAASSWRAAAALLCAAGDGQREGGGQVPAVPGQRAQRARLLQVPHGGPAHFQVLAASHLLTCAHFGRSCLSSLAFRLFNLIVLRETKTVRWVVEASLMEGPFPSHLTPSSPEHAERKHGNVLRLASQIGNGEACSC